MKKIVILCITILFVCSCGTKEEVKDTSLEEDNFILSKLDEDEDYIYYEDIDDLVKDNKEEYNLDLLKVNLNSTDVASVNLEIKTIVNQSYKNLVLDNNVVTEGSIISYKTYASDKYITVILDDDFYFNGSLECKNTYVYVISLEDGHLLANDDILELFSLDEEKLFKKIEDVIVSDDVLYSISELKNNGYDLFIDDDFNLGVIYSEVSNDDSIRKELILNN